jgi:hypothetical protein
MREKEIKLMTDFINKVTINKEILHWLINKTEEMKKTGFIKDQTLTRKELIQIKTTIGTNQQDLLFMNCIMIFKESKI